MNDSAFLEAFTGTDCSVRGSWLTACFFLFVPKLLPGLLDISSEVSFSNLLLNTVIDPKLHSLMVEKYFS